MSYAPIPEDDMSSSFATDMTHSFSLGSGSSQAPTFGSVSSVDGTNAEVQSSLGTAHPSGDSLALPAEHNLNHDLWLALQTLGSISDITEATETSDESEEEQDMSSASSATNEIHSQEQTASLHGAHEGFEILDTQSTNPASGYITPIPPVQPSETYLQVPAQAGNGGTTSSGSSDQQSPASDQSGFVHGRHTFFDAFDTQAHSSTSSYAVTQQPQQQNELSFGQQKQTEYAQSSAAGSFVQDHGGNEHPSFISSLHSPHGMYGAAFHPSYTPNQSYHPHHINLHIQSATGNETRAPFYSSLQGALTDYQPQAAYPNSAPSSQTVFHPGDVPAAPPPSPATSLIQRGEVRISGNREWRSRFHQKVEASALRRDVESRRAAMRQAETQRLELNTLNGTVSMLQEQNADLHRWNDDLRKRIQELSKELAEKTQEVERYRHALQDLFGNVGRPSMSLNTGAAWSS